MGVSLDIFLKLAILKGNIFHVILLLKVIILWKFKFSYKVLFLGLFYFEYDKLQGFLKPVTFGINIALAIANIKANNFFLHWLKYDILCITGSEGVSL